MSYYIRLFATDPLGSLLPVQAQIIQRGVPVKPVGTNQLDIIYHNIYTPLTLDLTDSRNDTTRQDLLSFLEVITRLPNQPNKQWVLDVLARTQALVAIGVPDDFPTDYAGMLDWLLDDVRHAVDGLTQVDGDGFYDGNTLILRIS